MSCETGFRVVVGSCLLAVNFGVTGCANSSPEGSDKPPLTVTVSEPLRRKVTDHQDYTGRTAAVDSVQIQARVTGYLVKIYFTEGEEVTKDTVLYEIDPRPYKAVYDSNKAQVAENVANLELAKLNNARFKKLAKDNPGAVVQTDLDKYQSQEEAATAALDKSRADLRTAELNLNWTKVTAPKTGLVGRLLVTQGHLIVANQTLLTTVVRQDPMWVYFDMDEPTALKVKELVRHGMFGTVQEGRPPKVKFGLRLAIEKGFPHEATLDFVNNQLDQATATLLIRGIFRNPKQANGPRVFTPNLFVRVRVPTSPEYKALLVNPEAVGTDQDLRYLYVVDGDHKVVRHNVKLGSLQEDGLQAITEGLEPGEHVIVKGIQRVRQGATVKPTLVTMPLPQQDAPHRPPVVKAPAPKK
jgi:RND family efflux transporter MFP subunit